MQDASGGSLSYSGNRFSLFRKLMLLRVVFLLACSVGILVLNIFLEKQFNLVPLVAVIFFGGVHSLYVWRTYARQPLISDWYLAMQLLIDGILLVSFVWFSGGSTNPFIYYLLVIVAISASIFPARFLWAFSFGGIATYTFLMYYDFNKHILHMPQDFQLHLLGMWLNFVGSALLISFFISRLTTALRDREILLAAAREETLKNEQLIGIGTLAASTVHSLGTPLSTIAVSVGELKEQNNNPESVQYLDLIRAQIDRCKQTMSKLTLLANSSELSDHGSLNNLVDDIQEYFLLVNANPRPRILNSSESDCLIPGNLLLKHALVNLIDNAIHAARSIVSVKFTADTRRLLITIEDDGDGLSAEIADNLGKPMMSSKVEGLGIGIFLANSTIEKLDGVVSFYNANPEANRPMTKVLVEIPLEKTAEQNDS